MEGGEIRRRESWVFVVFFNGIKRGIVGKVGRNQGHYRRDDTQKRTKSRLSGEVREGWKTR